MQKNETEFSANVVHILASRTVTDFWGLCMCTNMYRENNLRWQTCACEQ